MPDSGFVLRAIEYIEANLRKPLTVEVVANYVCVSLFHFSRVFSSATGHAPYDYLMRRRLSVAADDLLQTDDQVIDLALNYQFNAPETFSRAFSRMFGSPPSEVRKRGWLDRRLLLPRFDNQYLSFLADSGRPKPHSLPSMELAGLATLARSETIVDELTRLGRGPFPHLPDSNGQKVGVIIPLPASTQVQLMIGFIAESGQNIPSGLLRKHLPAATYAVGPVCSLVDLPLARRFLNHTWWPKSVGGSLPAWELVQWLEGGETIQIGLPLPTAR